MKKNIFILKKNKYKFFLINFLILLILIIFFFYYFFNKINYFIIPESTSKIYIIPDEKEGKKVEYINKKSINNLINNNQDQDQDLNKIENLGFTIQVYSDFNFESVDIYLNKLLKNKEQILNKNDFYFFVINSELGSDYFLTYKNFNTKDEAYKFCNNLSFIERCLILKIQ